VAQGQPKEPSSMGAAQSTITDDAIVIRLDGELDGMSAGVVRAALQEAAQGQPVVIDLEAVTFIDSAGLGAIIGGIRHVRTSGGSATFFGPRPSIRRLLETTGVDRLALLTPVL
jgi:anti-anti-sigma factor